MLCTHHLTLDTAAQSTDGVSHYEQKFTMRNSKMRAIQVSVGVAFLLMGLYVVSEAISMRYYTTYGPGPGFFPAWLGGALIVLSLAHIVGVARTHYPRPQFDVIPSAYGMRRIALTLAFLATFAVVLEAIGFPITMGALLFSLLRFTGQRNIFESALIAIIGSATMYYGFREVLGVYLPPPNFSL